MKAHLWIGSAETRPSPTFADTTSVQLDFGPYRLIGHIPGFEVEGVDVVKMLRQMADRLEENLSQH
jgi:hypothetical protein